MGTNEILAIALAALKKGGGGGGGTSNYNDLTNLPQVNGITLQGNKTSTDLGIVSEAIVAEEFGSTLAYSIGDFVLYEGDLYEFTADHTANDPWDSSEVHMWTIGDVIEGIKDKLDDVPQAIILTQAQYDALPSAEKLDTSKIYYVYDAVGPATGAVIDDTTTASNKLWSSQKTANEIASAGGAAIDDTTTAVNKVWSSSKTNTELSGKVDKVTGKNLSENDYTDADKAIVDGVTSALANKVDKVTGKGLSSEDYTTAEKTKLANIEAGAKANVQTDWNQRDSSADDFLKNRPELGTAALKDVPVSGNASTTQVVMGTDTRLTDARPASDVSAWAKAADKPTYTASEVGAIDATTAGVAGGVPTLDSSGKIPSSQLPSLSSQDISDLEGLIDD